MHGHKITRETALYVARGLDRRNLAHHA